MILLELCWRFALIGALAFGGGQAAFPLMERVAVAETGWLSAQEFAAAVAFGYITPGPVMIIATFVGYRAAGPAGALAATAGVFLLPAALAAAAERALHRYMRHPWLHGFGQGAAPAVIGLLAVTALNLARSSFQGWGSPAITAAALALALSGRVHPLWILAGGAAAGLALTLLPLPL